MNRSEWLACDDPARMLDYLLGSNPTPATERVSERKLRLFAVACVRSVWRLLNDDAFCPTCWQKGSAVMRLCQTCNGAGRVNRSRRAVEVAERFADGLASEVERALAMTGAFDVGTSWPNCVAWECCRTDEPVNPVRPEWRVPAEHLQMWAALLRCINGDPFRPGVVLPRDLAAVLRHGAQAHRQEDVILADWLTPTVLSLATAAYEERLQRRCTGRCAGCNRPGRYPDDDNLRRPIWLRCPDCDGSGVIEEGALDPARLAVLSDALEEAGAEGEILAHLRSPGPHVRGCWALDLILGKE